jgi:hypothetical protein
LNHFSYFDLFTWQDGLARALLERGVAAVDGRAIEQGHLGGCSAVLVALAPLNNGEKEQEQEEEEEQSGMRPFLTHATAATLGFLAVTGVKLSAGQLAGKRMRTLSCFNVSKC